MMNNAIREMELPLGECASITLTNVRFENVIKLITYVGYRSYCVGPRVFLATRL